LDKLFCADLPAVGEKPTPSIPGRNLYQRTRISDKSLTEPLSCLSTTANQLSACSYLYAANITRDALRSYTYDAENRVIRLVTKSLVALTNGNTIADVVLSGAVSMTARSDTQTGTGTLAGARTG